MAWIVTIGYADSRVHKPRRFKNPDSVVKYVRSCFSILPMELKIIEDGQVKIFLEVPSHDPCLCECHADAANFPRDRVTAFLLEDDNTPRCLKCIIH